MEILTGAAREMREFLAELRPESMVDNDLLCVTSAVEALGRIVDSARVALAAEVGDRSRVERGAARLSALKGCRNANELLQRVTLASSVTVERRLRLGTETRQIRSIVGVDFPARSDAVARALHAGRLGVDAATAITQALSSTFARAGIDELAIAERELVDAATGVSPDQPTAVTADDIRSQAAVWKVVLDPDGVEPDDARAMRRRGLRIGQDRDGVVRIEGSLVAEIGIKLRRAIDSYLNPKTGVVFLPGDEPGGRSSAGGPGGVHGPLDDSRSLEQKRHDIFASLIDAAARSGELPTAGGNALTVLVSVRAQDLATGSGAGWIDGAESPVSLRAVAQFACAGGIQKVMQSAAGRLISLGSPERCFTPHQRRAISVRDGGCVIPGCQVAAGWCEIHHVTPDAVGGATETDNGVLLCWFHHRTIDSSGWRVRMAAGVPQILAPPWLDRDARWRPPARSRMAIADGLDRRLEARARPVLRR